MSTRAQSDLRRPSSALEGSEDPSVQHSPPKAFLGEGEGLDEGVVKQVLKVLDQAESSTADQLAKVQEVNMTYEALIHVLGQHETNEGREVMVPMGPLAFMPGKLIKTHEVMAHLGDQWYTPTSPDNAIRVAQRRQEELAKTIQTHQKQIKEIQDRKSIMLFDGGLTSQKRYNEEGLEIVEIREEYHSDEEEAEEKKREVDPIKGQDQEKVNAQPGDYSQEDKIPVPSALTAVSPPPEAPINNPFGAPQLTKEDRDILRRMEELERELEGLDEDEEGEEGEMYESEEEGYGEEGSSIEEDAERQGGGSRRSARPSTSSNRRVHFGQVLSGLQEGDASSVISSLNAANTEPSPSPSSSTPERVFKGVLKPSSPLTQNPESSISSSSSLSRQKPPSTSSLVMESVMEKGLAEDPEDEAERLEEELHLREVEGRYQELRNARLLQQGGVRRSILEFGESKEERQEREDVDLMYDMASHRAPRLQSVPSIGKSEEKQAKGTSESIVQKKREKDLVRQLAKTHMEDPMDQAPRPTGPFSTGAKSMRTIEKGLKKEEEEEEEEEVKPRKMSRFMAARLARSGNPQ
ncbi:MAG: hypothetical protein DHS80DRAFT_29759 [Piptocephalis tieghemiana]|nr:MAG: hypothetical protein DHS80DRAFT_29759 [Piptocephalis tieghemiana]